MSSLICILNGQGRAGNGVGGAGLVIVDVVVNTGLARGVQRRSDDTAGHGRAGTSDLEVDALGVELGATDVVGTVKGNDLVTQDVVAGGNAGRDGHSPVEVIIDQGIRRPLCISSVSVPPLSRRVIEGSLT